MSEPPPKTIPAPASALGNLADAWISLAVGVVLLLLYPTFLYFISATLRGQPYRPFVDPTVDYSMTVNMWSDLALTAFAVVLILDGLVLLLARRPLPITIAFSFTVLTTAGNLLYLVCTYATYGLALASAFAVIFGVYIAIGQWRHLTLLRAGR